MTLERKARVGMDVLLVAAGTHVCDMAQANGHSAIGLAIREFPFSSGFGFVDYLFRINGRSWGLIKVRQHGAMLAGVELRRDRYVQGLLASPPALGRPLRSMWEPAGVVVTLFRPASLVQWLTCLSAQATSIVKLETSGALLARVQRVHMPVLRLPEQIRTVFYLGRKLSIVKEVEAETEPKRACAVWQATLAKAFSSQRKTGVSL